MFFFVLSTGVFFQSVKDVYMNMNVSTGTGLCGDN